MTHINDDGFCSHLVKNARFDGKFEIPSIEKNLKFYKPEKLIPFSARKRVDGKNDFVCFYEHDKKFQSFIENPQKYIGDLKKFKGAISPDCSLYIDMPLILQIADIYLNRAIGHYLQQSGIYVIPNIRWGDKRTYSDEYLGEKVAFSGIEKESIVSIGTYGQIQSKNQKVIFKEGLMSMLETINPSTVIVYGPMPKTIFSNLEEKVEFIRYDNWISIMKGDKNGYRN